MPWDFNRSAACIVSEAGGPGASNAIVDRVSSWRPIGTDPGDALSRTYVGMRLLAGLHWLGNRPCTPGATALLLALLPRPWLLMAGRSISGISAAVFGVMLPLVAAADLTSDRRHFNLCVGAFGLCSAAGATLSTAVGGWISDNAGHVPAFLILAAAGLAETLAIWALMPETAPILETRRVGNTRLAGANYDLTGV